MFLGWLANVNFRDIWKAKIMRSVFWVKKSGYQVARSVCKSSKCSCAFALPKCSPLLLHLFLTGAFPQTLRLTEYEISPVGLQRLVPDGQELHMSGLASEGMPQSKIRAEVS